MCRNTIKADFVLPTLRPLVVGWVEVLLFLYNPVGRARQTIFIIIITIINETSKVAKNDENDQKPN